MSRHHRHQKTQAADIALLFALQSAQVLEAELTKHKAANEGLERDVARFKERATLMKKVHLRLKHAATRSLGRLDQALQCQ